MLEIYSAFDSISRFSVVTNRICRPERARIEIAKVQRFSPRNSMNRSHGLIYSVDSSEANIFPYFPTCIIICRRCERKKNREWKRWLKTVWQHGNSISLPSLTSTCLAELSVCSDWRENLINSDDWLEADAASSQSPPLCLCFEDMSERCNCLAVTWCVWSLNDSKLFILIILICVNLPLMGFRLHNRPGTIDHQVTEINVNR